MSESDLDFDADELAMLRQLFRGEAHDALELVTARVLAGGGARPAGEHLAEMMRVTHTLKGAAGTVGLPSVVDLAHRLESALDTLGREPSPWTTDTADQIVEVVDGRRGYLDELADNPAAGALTIDRLRVQIDRIARGAPVSRTLTPLQRPRAITDTDPPGDATTSMAIPTIVDLPGDVTGTDLRPAVDHTSQRSALLRAPAEPGLADFDEPPADASRRILVEGDEAAPDRRAFLRVEPERVDARMSSAGELLFDRTRIERRVQLLRTLARALASPRQSGGG